MKILEQSSTKMTFMEEIDQGQNQIRMIKTRNKKRRKKARVKVNQKLKMNKEDLIRKAKLKVIFSNIINMKVIQS